MNDALLVSRRIRCLYFDGQEETLTAILTAVPSRPGLLMFTSSVPGVATVPPSILFAAGRTSISVAVTAVVLAKVEKDEGGQNGCFRLRIEGLGCCTRRLHRLSSK